MKSQRLPHRNERGTDGTLTDYSKCCDGGTSKMNKEEEIKVIMDEVKSHLEFSNTIKEQ
jgi:hypothetical protein